MSVFYVISEHQNIIGCSLPRKTKHPHLYHGCRWPCCSRIQGISCHGIDAFSWSGPVFCLLFGVSSDYAQPITGQVTEVTCPVIGWAQSELTPTKRQKTGPGSLQYQVTGSHYIDKVTQITFCLTWGPFYYHRLDLIPAWISNHIH